MTAPWQTSDHLPCQRMRHTFERHLQPVVGAAPFSIIFESFVVCLKRYRLPLVEPPANTHTPQVGGRPPSFKPHECPSRASPAWWGGSPSALDPRGENGAPRGRTGGAARARDGCDACDAGGLRACVSTRDRSREMGWRGDGGVSWKARRAEPPDPIRVGRLVHA